MGHRFVDFRTIQHRMNLKDARVQAEQRRRDALHPYQLPDGRIVQIHADVARGNILVSFTLADGHTVDAVRIDAKESR